MQAEMQLTTDLPCGESLGIGSSLAGRARIEKRAIDRRTRRVQMVSNAGRAILRSHHGRRAARDYPFESPFAVYPHEKDVLTERDKLTHCIERDPPFFGLSCIG